MPTFSTLPYASVSIEKDTHISFPFYFQGKDLTPLDVANDKGNHELGEYLESHGAKEIVSLEQESKEKTTTEKTVLNQNDKLDNDTNIKEIEKSGNTGERHESQTKLERQESHAKIDSDNDKQSNENVNVRGNKVSKINLISKEAIHNESDNVTKKTVKTTEKQKKNSNSGVLKGKTKMESVGDKGQKKDYESETESDRNIGMKKETTVSDASDDEKNTDIDSSKKTGNNGNNVKESVSVKSETDTDSDRDVKNKSFKTDSKKGTSPVTDNESEEKDKAKARTESSDERKTSDQTSPVRSDDETETDEPYSQKSHIQKKSQRISSESESENAESRYEKESEPQSTRTEKRRNIKPVKSEKSATKGPTQQHSKDVKHSDTDYDDDEQSDKDSEHNEKQIVSKRQNIQRSNRNTGDTYDSDSVTDTQQDQGKGQKLKGQSRNTANTQQNGNQSDSAENDNIQTVKSSIHDRGHDTTDSDMDHAKTDNTDGENDERTRINVKNKKTTTEGDSNSDREHSLTTEKRSSSYSSSERHKKQKSPDRQGDQQKRNESKYKEKKEISNKERPREKKDDQKRRQQSGHQSNNKENRSEKERTSRKTEQSYHSGEKASNKRNEGKAGENRNKDEIGKENDEQADSKQQQRQSEQKQRREDSRNEQSKPLSIQRSVMLFEQRKHTVESLNRARRMQLYNTFRGNLPDASLLRILQDDYSSRNKMKRKAPEVDSVSDWENYLLSESIIVLWPTCFNFCYDLHSYNIFTIYIFYLQLKQKLLRMKHINTTR